MSPSAALDDERLEAKKQRAVARNYLANPQPPTNFGDLLAPTVAARLARAAEVEIATGYDSPDDDSEECINWIAKTVTRKEAADALRAARHNGWRIHLRAYGFGVYAGPNPAWRYR